MWNLIGMNNKANSYYDNNYNVIDDDNINSDANSTDFHKSNGNNANV